MKFAAAIFVLLVLQFGTAKAEPGWEPTIIATGAKRQQIQATPIEQRPYRPFHFYGNTVRRMHYRGRMLPTVSDLGLGRSVRMFRRR